MAEEAVVAEEAEDAEDAAEAEDATEEADVVEEAEEAEAAKQPGSPQLFFRPVLNMSCITVTVFPQLLHLHTQ